MSGYFASTNFKKRQKTAAVCVSGLFRCPHMLKENIESLKTHNPDYEFKLFVHLWKVSDYQIIVNEHRRGNQQNSFNRGEDVLDLNHLTCINEIETLCVQPFDNNINFLQRELSQRNYTQDKFSGGDKVCIISMFYGIWRTNEMVREYCDNNDHTFDVQIRMRTDLRFNEPVCIDKMTPGHVNVETGTRYHNGTPDLFAIGSQQLMHKYSQTFKLTDVLYHPETMLKVNCERHNVPWVQTYNVVIDR